MPPVNRSKASLPAKVYPSIDVKACIGKDALTAELAKRLLGWTIQTVVTSPDDYIIVDEEGSKIACKNNTNNRPLNEEWSRTLAQDILNRRWKINLETIIIGEYGNVISGQHRLIALVLASQMWRANKVLWSKWTSEPFIETLVAFGADESEECVRTIDNVRPRTLYDVLFTSQLFKGFPVRERKQLSRSVGYAINTLWQRTKIGRSTSSKQTHSEAVDFLNAHQRIMECAKHIHEEDRINPIKKFIGLGYASAAMYLMAASDDDQETYTNEASLTLGQLDNAIKFWTEFYSVEFKPLRTLLAARDDNNPITVYDQLGMVAKAWNAYKANEPMTEENLCLAYTTDNEGFKTLDEFPVFGGIDLGFPNANEVNDDE